ncbi:glycoprotein-N-acetylgalactosamine 3-beta-galactosyltransferase 1 [Drosophila willistoni]|uniref:glycoprotein-N-acetylgalactosamine 3-beta-galactosyltransferase 1 n=1 Tax=Drosophila willistoni TaxID=7260 RepID=UPI00017D66FB|nr:glycoprotein-N-acetylgalactosamine 3-beta-galactosyltransferase 1 [Drosophila willistoni]
MYRNALCLVLGLIIGIRLTDIFVYMRLTSENDMLYIETPAATPQVMPTESVNIHNDEHNDLASLLYNETRVFCMVLTMPKSHATKAAGVKRTWGKRCNKLIFLSSEDDAELGAVNLHVKEKRGNLYAKVRAGFAYVHEHYGEDYDWYLKADDDTFVIMENLRWFLYPFDPDALVFFGHRFRSNFPQGYMSGGAGYVLSRGALQQLNHIGFKNSIYCPSSKLSEDRHLGLCLSLVGVVAGDSRDEKGRERFLPMAPKHLLPHTPQGTWLDRYYFFRPQSSDITSDTGISFHYVTAMEMHLFEYFMYQLNISGLPLIQKKLPPRLTIQEMQEKLNFWAKLRTNNNLQLVHEQSTSVN